MGTESAHDAEVEPAASAGASPPSAATGATAALAGPEALAALAGRHGSATALARSALALQRSAGNAAIGRLLARQPIPEDTGSPWFVEPPPGSSRTIVQWVIEKTGAKEGRDLVGILTGSELLLYSAAANPSLIEKGERGTDEPPWGNSPKLMMYTQHGLSRVLVTSGTPRVEGWHWWFASPGPPESLVAAGDQARIKAIVPVDPGRLFVVIPSRHSDKEEEPIEVTVHDDGSSWALPKAQKAKDAIKQLRDSADEDPYDDGPSYSLPDKLTPWRRDDGKWFLNVQVGPTTKGGVPHHVKSLELSKKESTQSLVDRIRLASSQLHRGQDPTQSVAVGQHGQGKGARQTGFVGTEKGEIEIPEGLTIDPTGGRATNREAFPARLFSHGDQGSSGNHQFEITVTGATVRFTMDLNFSAGTSSIWEELGNAFQVIDYRWELIDISSFDLEQVKGRFGGATQADMRRQIEQMKAVAALAPSKEAADAQLKKVEGLEAELKKRQAEPDSGAARDIARDFSNIGEDGAKDSWMYMISPGLMAVSDVVGMGGSLVHAGFSELAAASSDRSVAFAREGLFLLRCYAQPVITDDDIERIKAKGIAAGHPRAERRVPAGEGHADPHPRGGDQRRRAQADRRARAQARHAAVPVLHATTSAQLAWRRPRRRAPTRTTRRSTARSRPRTPSCSIRQWRETQGQVPDRPDATRRCASGRDARHLGRRARRLRARPRTPRSRSSARRSAASRRFAVKHHHRAAVPPAAHARVRDRRGVYPIVANLAQGTPPARRAPVWQLIDLTLPRHAGAYVGRGATHQRPRSRRR